MIVSPSTNQINMETTSDSIHVAPLPNNSNCEWEHGSREEHPTTTKLKVNSTLRGGRFLSMRIPSSSTREEEKIATSSHDLAACAAAEASEHFGTILLQSPLNTCTNRDCIAPFKKSEVRTGKLLGSGEFSHVYEIKSFLLDASQDTEASSSESETRRLMKACEKYRDTKKARYALKHLRVELVDTYTSEEYAQFASDISKEASFLSVLQHPNIIKLRGISFQGSAAFQNGPCG